MIDALLFCVGYLFASQANLGLAGQHKQRQKNVFQYRKDREREDRDRVIFPVRIVAPRWVPGVAGILLATKL